MLTKRTAFEAADKDNNGDLSVEEYAAAFGETGFDTVLTPTATVSSAANVQLL